MRNKYNTNPPFCQATFGCIPFFPVLFSKTGPKKAKRSFALITAKSSTPKSYQRKQSLLIKA